VEESALMSIDAQRKQSFRGDLRKLLERAVRGCGENEDAIPHPQRPRRSDSEEEVKPAAAVGAPQEMAGAAVWSATMTRWRECALKPSESLDKSRFTRIAGADFNDADLGRAARLARVHWFQGVYFDYETPIVGLLSNSTATCGFSQNGLSSGLA
jgi:hypothetical protein